MSVIWMRDFKLIGACIDIIFILPSGKWLLLPKLFPFLPYFLCLSYWLLLFLSILSLNILHLLLPVLIEHLYLFLHILLMLLPINATLLHLLLDLNIDFFGLIELFFIDLVQVFLYFLPLSDLPCEFGHLFFISKELHA